MGAICLYCGRRHIIVANALFCLACTIGLTHRCPVCKKVVPGRGFEPCPPADRTGFAG